MWAGEKSGAVLNFAMRCKEVARHIDLNDSKMNAVGRFRMILHLSLCQACTNYRAFSVVLRKQAKQLTVREVSSEEIKTLNNRLLNHFKN